MTALSCSNPVAGSLKKSSDLSPPAETRKSAQLLVDLYQASTASSGRSASPGTEVSNEVTEFFNNQIIEDEVGNPLNFATFGQAEKDAYLKAWVDARAAELLEKVQDEPTALESLADDNAAAEQALKEVGGRAVAGAHFADFRSRYASIRQRLQADRSAAARVARTVARTQYTEEGASTAPIQANVDEFKSHWKRGRVMINLSDGESSGYYWIGHASIVTADAWNPDWYKFGLQLGATTSSWQPKGVWWTAEGAQENGVQEEPVGEWVAHRGLDTVKMNSVVSEVRKWNGLVLYTYHYEASSSEYNESADRAYGKIGLPYPPGARIADKFLTTEYSCTSLVWRAWYNTHHKYDLDYGILDAWVSPQDMHDAGQSKQIAVWYNK